MRGLNFTCIIPKKATNFCQTNARNFFSIKVYYNFSAKSTATVDFVSTVRLKKSSTNDLVKLTML